MLMMMIMMIIIVVTVVVMMTWKGAILDCFILLTVSWIYFNVLAHVAIVNCMSKPCTTSYKISPVFFSCIPRKTTDSEFDGDDESGWFCERLFWSLSIDFLPS